MNWLSVPNPKIWRLLWSQKTSCNLLNLDSTAVSIFVDILVVLTNTLNSSNISTNIETTVLSGQLAQEKIPSDLTSP